MLESLLEGMNEFYSRNLAREVQKGNAKTLCRRNTLGASPPLGYTVNPKTLLLEKEPFESQAVQLIFRLYLEGAGYTEILNELNERGYRTKRGNPLGKILFMKFYAMKNMLGLTSTIKAPKRCSRKMNRHRLKANQRLSVFRMPYPLSYPWKTFQRVK